MPQRVLVWVGSSKKDLTAFPDDVRYAMGHALWLAETGGKHPDAKPPSKGSAERASWRSWRTTTGTPTGRSIR